VVFFDLLHHFRPQGLIAPECGFADQIKKHSCKTESIQHSHPAAMSPRHAEWAKKNTKHSMHDPPPLIVQNPTKLIPIPLSDPPPKLAVWGYVGTGQMEGGVGTFKLFVKSDLGIKNILKMRQKIQTLFTQKMLLHRKSIFLQQFDFEFQKKVETAKKRKYFVPFDF